MTSSVRGGYITSMPVESEANDPANGPARPQADNTDRTPTPMPPRPRMTDAAPAPVYLPPAPPGTVRASRSLWITSFVAGMVAVVFAFLSRTSQFERLQEMVTELRSDQDSETVDAVGAVVFWGSLGGLVLVLILEVLLLRGMMRGRRGVRGTQLLLLFIHAGVTVLAVSFIAASDGSGIYIQILLLLQLLLAGAAFVVSLFPGSGAWFRSEHQRRSRPSS